MWNNVIVYVYGYCDDGELGMGSAGVSKVDEFWQAR